MNDIWVNAHKSGFSDWTNQRMNNKINDRQRFIYVLYNLKMKMKKQQRNAVCVRLWRELSIDSISVSNKWPHKSLITSDKSLNQVLLLLQSAPGQWPLLHNSRAIKWNKKIKWIPRTHSVNGGWQMAMATVPSSCHSSSSSSSTLTQGHKCQEQSNHTQCVCCACVCVCVCGCATGNNSGSGWPRSRRLKTKTIKGQLDSISFFGALESMLHPHSHTLFTLLSTHTDHLAKYCAGAGCGCGQPIKPI